VNGTTIGMLGGVQTHKKLYFCLLHARLENFFLGC
jgi:hypothetical protein